MATRKQTTSDVEVTPRSTPGAAGETHQTAASGGDVLTTNHGLAISDNQNSLKVGPRGPVLLEDFVLREKITHFDHERIPERVVHARGFGAHGYFQPNKSHSRLTKAAFLQDPAVKTPVFVRFSTVAGSEGSADLARDVRGFAVKFYTGEGNYDLVGNNIPVFFIQDAMKFPDLIHAVKPEPDRGFPQAASAHDTFWDFASLTPESTHMLMWAMSDRAIPRSFRMMQGFGVHTFKLVNAKGAVTLVKFHWRPRLGTVSLIWDEAVKVNGADPDFHRRDLWDAIEAGDYPEYDLAVQCFTEEEAEQFEFDVLDPTKLVPEELVPLTVLGTMVLDRRVDNFFAETEQVAFCPANLVPGIELTNDPLLQGRLFSYLDTQLSRLGGPNFQQIPINRPHVPVMNLQRDGHMQVGEPQGRVAYEPNSLDPSAPREDPKRGFVSDRAEEAGTKLRIRPESFADHYSQARQFWKSMTEPEQQHIVNAFAFELGKCEQRAIRQRMLGRLRLVDTTLESRVADKLGMAGEAAKLSPAVAVQDFDPSPALSQYGEMEPSLAGRKLAILVTDGCDAKLVATLRKAAAKEGATLKVVAPTVGGVKAAGGEALSVDLALAGSPSVLFDAVVVAASSEGAATLERTAAAVEWVRDAYGHLKAIGYTAAAAGLLKRAGVEGELDEAVVTIEGKGLGRFIDAAKQHRCWEREARLG
jgi:catalase